MFAVFFSTDGALLARTQVFVDQAKLSDSERQDVRIPALEDALECI